MTHPERETGGLCEPVAYRWQWPETMQWHYADYNLHPEAETVEALYGPEASSTIRAQAAELERLRGALRYYAGPHEFPNDGPWGLQSDDYGQVAALALKTEGTSA